MTYVTRARQSYTDISPPGGTPPVSTSYKRWCSKCNLMCATKGGKVRNKRFCCAGCCVPRETTS